MGGGRAGDRPRWGERGSAWPHALSPHGSAPAPGTLTCDGRAFPDLLPAGMDRRFLMLGIGPQGREHLQVSIGLLRDQPQPWGRDAGSQRPRPGTSSVACTSCSLDPEGTLSPADKAAAGKAGQSPEGHTGTASYSRLPAPRASKTSCAQGIIRGRCQPRSGSHTG